MENMCYVKENGRHYYYNADDRFAAEYYHGRTVPLAIETNYEFGDVDPFEAACVRSGIAIEKLNDFTPEITSLLTEAASVFETDLESAMFLIGLAANWKHCPRPIFNAQVGLHMCKSGGVIKLGPFQGRRIRAGGRDWPLN